MTFTEVETTMPGGQHQHAAAADRPTRTRLTWPAGVKRTAIRSEWFERLSKMPPGLDLQELARRLGEPYGRVYRWVQTFGYPTQRKTGVAPEQWAAVDWNRRDAEIARELEVSREYVRQVRSARNIGPGERLAAVRNFRQFVADHAGRRHH